MTDIVKIDYDNPDSQVVGKDISISLFEVSSSGYSASVSTNYDSTYQKINVSFDPSLEVPITSGYVYYTPIYKEKLNYNEWIVRVNKNFEELD